MGQVWQATDTQLNRQVALKILPDAFADDPDRLARFTREAQILASLSHPNIAAIYGIEEAEGTRALVLELVEGPTLADRIGKGRSRWMRRSRLRSRWWGDRGLAFPRGRLQQRPRRCIIACEKPDVGKVTPVECFCVSPQAARARGRHLLCYAEIGI